MVFHLFDPVSAFLPPKHSVPAVPVLQLLPVTVPHSAPALHLTLLQVLQTLFQPSYSRKKNQVLVASAYIQPGSGKTIVS